MPQFETLKRRSRSPLPADRRPLRSMADGHGAGGIQQIHRSCGNQYVLRMLEHAITPALVQTKLTVGAAGDKYEQEADQVAQQVMRAIGQPTVQRAENVGLEGGEAGPVVEQSIHNARGGGHGLPETFRRSMEGAFAADFGGVRVHTDDRADAANASLSARAFATGQDIFFRQGQYNPGSAAGQELLAHELTHVVQQTGKPALQARGAPVVQTKLVPGLEKGTWLWSSDYPDRKFFISVPDREGVVERLFGGKKFYRVASEHKDEKFPDQSVAVDAEGWFTSKEEMLAARRQRTVGSESDDKSESKDTKSDSESDKTKLVPAKTLKEQGKILLALGKAMKAVAEKPYKATKAAPDTKPGAALKVAKDIADKLNKVANAFPPLKAVTKPIQMTLSVIQNVRDGLRTYASVKKGETIPLLLFQEAKQQLADIPQSNSSDEQEFIQRSQDAIDALERVMLGFVPEEDADAFSGFEASD